MDFKKFLPWIIAAVVIEFTAGLKELTAVVYEQDIKEPGVCANGLPRRNDLIGNLVNTVKVQPTLKREP
jgi:hypothetical protein